MALGQAGEHGYWEQVGVCQIYAHSVAGAEEVMHIIQIGGHVAGDSTLGDLAGAEGCYQFLGLFGIGDAHVDFVGNQAVHLSAHHIADFGFDVGCGLQTHEDPQASGAAFVENVGVALVDHAVEFVHEQVQGIVLILAGVDGADIADQILYNELAHVGGDIGVAHGGQREIDHALVLDDIAPRQPLISGGGEEMPDIAACQ